MATSQIGTKSDGERKRNLNDPAVRAEASPFYAALAANPERPISQSSSHALELKMRQAAANEQAIAHAVPESLLEEDDLDESEEKFIPPEQTPIENPLVFHNPFLIKAIVYFDFFMGNTLLSGNSSVLLFKYLSHFYVTAFIHESNSAHKALLSAMAKDSELDTMDKIIEKINEKIEPKMLQDDKNLYDLFIGFFFYYRKYHNALKDSLYSLTLLPRFENLKNVFSCSNEGRLLYNGKTWDLRSEDFVSIDEDSSKKLHDVVLSLSEEERFLYLKTTLAVKLDSRNCSDADSSQVAYYLIPLYCEIFKTLKQAYKINLTKTCMENIRSLLENVVKKSKAEIPDNKSTWEDTNLGRTAFEKLLSSNISFIINILFLARSFSGIPEGTLQNEVILFWKKLIPQIAHYINEKNPLITLGHLVIQNLTPKALSQFDSKEIYPFCQKLNVLIEKGYRFGEKLSPLGWYNQSIINEEQYKRDIRCLLNSITRDPNTVVQDIFNFIKAQSPESENYKAILDVLKDRLSSLPEPIKNKVLQEFMKIFLANPDKESRVHQVLVTLFDILEEQHQAKLFEWAKKAILNQENVKHFELGHEIIQAMASRINEEQAGETYHLVFTHEPRALLEAKENRAAISNLITYTWTLLKLIPRLPLQMIFDALMNIDKEQHSDIYNENASTPMFITLFNRLKPEEQNKVFEKYLLPLLTYEILEDECTSFTSRIIFNKKKIIPRLIREPFGSFFRVLFDGKRLKIDNLSISESTAKVWADKIKALVKTFFQKDDKKNNDNIKDMMNSLKQQMHFLTKHANIYSQLILFFYEHFTHHNKNKDFREFLSSLFTESPRACLVQLGNQLLQSVVTQQNILDNISDCEVLVDLLHVLQDKTMIFRMGDILFKSYGIHFDNTEMKTVMSKFIMLLAKLNQAVQSDNYDLSPYFALMIDKKDHKLLTLCGQCIPQSHAIKTLDVLCTYQNNYMDQLSQILETVTRLMPLVKAEMKAHPHVNINQNALVLIDLCKKYLESSKRSYSTELEMKFQNAIELAFARQYLGSHEDQDNIKPEIRIQQINILLGELLPVVSKEILPKYLNGVLSIRTPTILKIMPGILKQYITEIDYDHAVAIILQLESIIHRTDLFESRMVLPILAASLQKQLSDQVKNTAKPVLSMLFPPVIHNIVEDYLVERPRII